jgi:type IV pilus assembly protein PilV
MMKKQRGMGMIEILMAVLITAIGLIGITGMQAVSLKNNLSALNRSNAIFLTGTIVDRIRANPSVSYETDLGVGPLTALNSCSLSTDTCAPSAIATLNIAQWKCSLGGYPVNDNCRPDPTQLGLYIVPIMPDAQGEITLDGSGDYVITIQWTDRVSYAAGVKTGGQLVSLSTTLRR